MLWILLTAMTVVAAVGLTIPLVRRHDARRSGPRNIEVLADQLRDIDIQAADGTLPVAEAEGLKTEVARRILAEGPGAATPARPLGERALLTLGLGLVVVLAVAATVLYSKIGRPDLATTSAPRSATVEPTDAAHPGGGDIAVMIRQLEAKMKQSPGDPEGWRMLGWSYMRTGRYGEAANAYGKAAALAPTNAEFLSAQGEALTQAAGGEVTPAARTAFRSAIVREPGDPRARFFLAVAKDQGGDHAGAMADWIALLKSAPAGAPWIADVRASVERIARQHGEDVAGKLPPAPAATAAADAAPPGPNADQVAAAQQMAPGDQQAMIAGMVDRLAARLKANPKDPDGWVRLMRARMVLGETGAAAGALHDALAAYADSPPQQVAFHAAARELRIPGV